MELELFYHPHLTVEESEAQSSMTCSWVRCWREVKAQAKPRKPSVFMLLHIFPVMYPAEATLLDNSTARFWSQQKTSMCLT